MIDYAVVFEEEGGSVGAWVPDLPGCVAVGGSHDEARRLIAEAITVHLDAMRAHGAPAPAPSSRCEYVTVASHTA
jgi:predicted RNase H-like HicB family nuclease